MKLEIMAKVAKILAVVIVFILLALIGFFFLLLAGIALSEYLNTLLDSTFYGYLIVSGLILLIMITLISLLKSGRIQSWLESFILKIGED